MLIFKSTLHVRLLIEFETNQIIGTVQAPFVDLMHSWRKAMKWSFNVFLFNQIRARSVRSLQTCECSREIGFQNTVFSCGNRYAVGRLLKNLT